MMDPKEYLSLRLNRLPSGKRKILIYTPARVMPIHTKEELHEQLKHYSKLLLSLTVHDSTAARRFHIEQQRPALRFYCKKYEVPIPQWLKDDSYYTEMPKPELAKLVGPKALRISDFKRIKPVTKEYLRPRDNE